MRRSSLLITSSSANQIPETCSQVRYLSIFVRIAAAATAAAQIVCHCWPIGRLLDDTGSSSHRSAGHTTHRHGGRLTIARLTLREAGTDGRRQGILLGGAALADAAAAAAGSGGDVGAGRRTHRVHW